MFCKIHKETFRMESFYDKVAELVLKVFPSLAFSYELAVFRILEVESHYIFTLQFHYVIYLKYAMRFVMDTTKYFIHQD